MEVPNSCSWIWRNILKLRRSFLPLVRFKLSTVSLCNFWSTPWLGNGVVLDQLFSIQQKHQSGIGINALARDHIVDGKLVVPYSSNQEVRGFWKHYEQCSYVQPERDTVLWNDRAHSISGVYNALHGIEAMPDCKWFHVTWSPASPASDNLVYWKVISDALMTKDKLVRMSMPVLSTCVLCQQHDESVHHLFFECDFVQHLWSNMLRTVQGNLPSHNNLNPWLLIEHALGWKDDVRLYFFFILKRLLRVTWSERNKRVFEGKCCSKVILWAMLKIAIVEGMNDSPHCFYASEFDPWLP